MSAAFHLALAQLGGDVADVLLFAPQMLALVQQPDVKDATDGPRDEGARAIALSALGMAQLSVGELAAAQDSLNRGLAAAEQAGLSCLRLICTSTLSLLRALQGELRLAVRTAQDALGIPSCPGHRRMVHTAHAYLALAIAHYEWDEVDDADRYLNLASGASEPARDPALAAAIAIVRALLLQARGDLTQGYETLLAGRRDLGDQVPSTYLGDWFTTTEADLRTSYGDTGTARELLGPRMDDALGISAPVAVALARTYLRDDDPSAAAREVPDWTGDGGGGHFLGGR